MRALFLSLVCLLVFSTCAKAYDEAELRDLLKRNDELSSLADFRDDEAALRLKLSQLDRVNAYRREAGSPEVKFDLLAGRVANLKARYAAENGYWGHWDIDGYKPYQRYGLSGGLDHVSENAYEKTTTVQRYPGKNPECSMDEPQKIDADMKEALDAFMAEGPGGKHHDTILDPVHNFVGFGYHCAASGTPAKMEFRVRYYDEFLNRYVKFDPPPLKLEAGKEIAVSGETIPDDHGPYMIAVYYDPIPEKMTPDDLNSLPPAYPDFGKERVVVLPPWQIAFDPQKRRFAFQFRGDKKGLYYIQVLLKKGVAEIPYDPSKTGGAASISSSGLLYASGIVINVE